MLHRNRRPAADVPTSSMADVAMLLMAFFLITTVFTQDAGLPARLAAAPNGPPEAGRRTALQLELDREGAWLLQGERIPPRASELTARLAVLLEGSPDRPLFLLTDPEAPLGAFVEVQDALRRSERDLRADAGLGLERLHLVVPTLAQQQELARRAP